MKPAVKWRSADNGNTNNAGCLLGKAAQGGTGLREAICAADMRPLVGVTESPQSTYSGSTSGCWTVWDRI